MDTEVVLDAHEWWREQEDALPEEVELTLLPLQQTCLGELLVQDRQENIQHCILMKPSYWWKIYQNTQSTIS